MTLGLSYVSSDNFFCRMSTVSENYKLSEGDIPILVEILTPVNYKWEDIATALGLPQFVKEQCRTSTKSIAFTNVLQEWISGNGNKNITLGQLKKALSQQNVGSSEPAELLISDFNKLIVGNEQQDGASMEKGK